MLFGGSETDPILAKILDRVKFSNKNVAEDPQR